MQTIWERIETWLNTYAPEALENLRDGAADQDIQQLEATLGYTLPADVRASLRRHNGTRVWFADIWQLLSVEEVLLSYQTHRKVAEDFFRASQSDPVRIGQPPPSQRHASWAEELIHYYRLHPWEVYGWYPWWIPVADTRCGGSLCVNVAAQPAQEFGQIIFFDPEGAAGYYRRGLLAPSFQALLSGFADHLEAGKYAFAPVKHEQGVYPLGAFQLRSQERLFTRPQLLPGAEAKRW